LKDFKENTIIAVVGHGGFFKDLFGITLGNCDFYEMDWKID
jgi:hypothetical protein